VSRASRSALRVSETNAVFRVHRHVEPKVPTPCELGRVSFGEGLETFRRCIREEVDDLRSPVVTTAFRPGAQPCVFREDTGDGEKKSGGVLLLVLRQRMLEPFEIELALVLVKQIRQDFCGRGVVMRQLTRLSEQLFERCTRGDAATLWPEWSALGGELASHGIPLLVAIGHRPRALGRRR
jgi:hypothetical protein